VSIVVTAESYRPDAYTEPMPQPTTAQPVRSTAGVAVHLDRGTRHDPSDPPLPPLRWLSAADVTAAMPPIEERLRLAERTMTALVADAELPPKIGVNPRPRGAFAHAMPAALRGSAEDGSEDGLGIKWIAGFGTNSARGLPAIHATVILNEPTTGVPIAILDGAPITAHRTAAVSGLAIRRLGPIGTRGLRAAIVGAGVQGRSHVEMLGNVLPGVELIVFDRHPERAAALAGIARETKGIARASSAPSARDATANVDVVVTAASFSTGVEGQTMSGDWFAPEALVVAIDYATCVAADVASGAALFLVDERGQFLANRDAGAFEGYPDPSGTLGEAILAGTQRPSTGRVLVSHLGVGLADVIFGRAILERATELGIGLNLPR
jgi:alanine dehydrogenase